MKITTIISILTLLCFKLSAQNLEGRKIINGNMTATISSSKNSKTYVNISTGLLYGKIKNDNTYWAYGGNFSTSAIDGTNSRLVFIGPAIERGKFVKIIDKLYIAPYIGGSISGVFGDFKGVNLNVYASPVRFMYNFSEHFMLSAGFGSANLTFIRYDDSTVFSLGASLTNNSNFGVFYTFK
jgi:hypothetical protein